MKPKPKSKRGRVKRPFKVGQRIRHKFANQLGTVTRHTESGFKWKLDNWIVTSPWSRYRTGETFPDGYYQWEAHDHT